MTTHQAYFNHNNQNENTSGIAVIFFLLGAPNIYGALKQRSQTSPTVNKKPVWAVGLGILAFVTAGAWSCVSAMS